jgi:L-lactate dehydrogenase complex protein LldG
MNTYDEQFLGRVRASLGYSPKQRRSLPSLFPSEPDEKARYLLEKIESRTKQDRFELLNTVIAAAKPLNLNVIAKKNVADVSADIARLVQEKKPEWGILKSVAVWRHPLIQRLNLADMLAPQDVPVYETGIGTDGKAEREQLRKQITDAYIGITSADYCIAETATLVMKTRPGHARSVSLVPAIHLAVIQITQIIENLKELYTLLKWHPQARAEGLTNAMTLITGPSKTADIEATLVHGAHGPRELYLYIITEESVRCDS